jgi:hypothetical protein
LALSGPLLALLYLSRTPATKKRKLLNRNSKGEIILSRRNSGKSEAGFIIIIYYFIIIYNLYLYFIIQGGDRMISTCTDASFDFTDVMLDDDYDN